MRRRVLAWLLLPSVSAGLCGCRDERGPEPEVSRTAGSPPAPRTTAGLGGSGDAKPAVPEMQGGDMVKVGEAAPAFEARDHTGQMRKLSDYKGKRVVLWFYPKASTGG